MNMATTIPFHNIHSVRVHGMMSRQAVLGSLCTICGSCIEVFRVAVCTMEKIGCIYTFPTRKSFHPVRFATSKPRVPNTSFCSVVIRTLTDTFKC